MASGVDHYDVYRDGRGSTSRPSPKWRPHGWSDVAGSRRARRRVRTAIPRSWSQSTRPGMRPRSAAAILMDSAAPTSRGSTGLSPVSAAPTITVTTTTDQAEAWRPVSITTTSTGTARRSTFGDPRGRPVRLNVTSQDVDAGIRCARLHCTPSSPSMLPVIRPRRRRLTVLVDRGAVVAPTGSQPSDDSDEPAPR